MSWPVPEKYPITTPWGRRGPYWSCNENSNGDGVHTGCDFACPAGTPLYATIAGEVRHRNYGSAFGSHQFAISPDPGQPYADGEVFYAHARKRLADGTRVKPGDWVGEAGAEGNVTGPHLHYEFHPHAKGVWSCTVHADPTPTLQGGTVSAYDYEYLGKPGGTLTVGTSYRDLDQSSWDPPRAGWENTLIYLNITPTRWASGKSIGAVRVRIIRADGDATAYEDLIVAKEALEDGSTLRTYTYWEQGDGKKTHVELRCQGGLLEAAVSTRYTKKCVVVD